MSEKFNELTNALNEQKDVSKDLKDKLEGVEKDLSEATREKDTAIKLVKAMEESLNKEEFKSKTMETAVLHSTQKLDKMM